MDPTDNDAGKKQPIPIQPKPNPPPAQPTQRHNDRNVLPPPTDPESLKPLTLQLCNIYQSGDYTNPNLAYYLAEDFHVVNPQFPDGVYPEIGKKEVDVEECQRERDDYNPEVLRPKSATLDVHDDGGHVTVWVTFELEGDLERVLWREIVNRFFWRWEGRWRLWKSEEFRGVPVGV